MREGGSGGQEGTHLAFHRLHSSQADSVGRLSINDFHLRNYRTDYHGREVCLIVGRSLFSLSALYRQGMLFSWVVGVSTRMCMHLQVKMGA